MEANELKRNLSYFIGTEQWYHHPLRREMLYTDGVKFFAEHAGGGAYWFLDIVATEIFPLLAKEPFMLVELQVEDSNVCRIVVSDGDGNEVYTKDIDYTDCPAGLWKFYLTDNVLLLPSEY
jgi:hypothetical protein